MGVRFFDKLIMDLPRDFRAASYNYKSVVAGILGREGVASCIEMGGGRDPLFSFDEAKALEVDYVVNDISARELQLCDSRFKKIHGDLCTVEPRGVDFIFSRMVYEHVEDNELMMKALLGHLNKGGCVLHLHPLLGSPPFILNKLLPDGVSRRILSAFFKNRTDDGTPKFPAFYDQCWATRGQEAKLVGWGFSDAVCVPFWGHNYYDKIPFGKVGEKMSRKLFSALGLRRTASFSYTFAVK